MQIGTLDQVLTGKGDALRWEEHYRLAHELGFEGIELGVRADNYDRTQLWDAAGRVKLRAVSKETGVATCSLCLHAFWQYSLAHENPEVRGVGDQIARQAVQAASELGARHILIPLTCPEGVETKVARDRWIAGMRVCAPAAVESGVTFCLENVGKTFSHVPELVAEIVDGIDSPAVQVYFDPGNMVYAGLEPLHGLDVLGTRIAQVHVKEMGGGKLLGEGAVPWPEIIARLRGMCYEGWLVLETETTDDPRAAAAQNLRTLRGWLGD